MKKLMIIATLGLLAAGCTTVKYKDPNGVEASYKAFDPLKTRNVTATYDPDTKKLDVTVTRTADISPEVISALATAIDEAK